ncbi:MAG TPA: polysaccharide deacetylase family protein [Gemmatimonadales bacterium]|nr:polysaccharide deacetylase family protein [Gemmatimonadales bacterium]
MPLVPAIGLGAAALGTLACGAWGVYEPNAPLFGPVIGAGPPDGGAVYLTFDDGPNPGVTDRILETLARHGVPAAFFMVGRYAERHAALVRAVSGAGHVVGNHTWAHVKLHRRGPARIRCELERTHRALADLTGAAPRAFRAPHGYRNPFVARTARRLGYATFGWSYGVWDTARPGAEVIRARMRRKLRPGAILLLHDGDGYDPAGDRTQTADALPGIIADVRAAGLEFRPLTDLLPA